MMNRTKGYSKTSVNDIVGLIAIAFILFGCKNASIESTPELDDNGDFMNYITVSNTAFMDGEKKFYPMVMNYSMDVHADNSENEVVIFATPRAGYHPKYGDGEGEDLGPWTRDQEQAREIVGSHFSLIKEMGFNTLRITGFTATDYFKEGSGFHTWSRLDISNTPEGTKNITEYLMPAMRSIIELAEEHQLRVILLLSAVETHQEDQVNFYERVAEGLKDEKGLMAYDLFNEPLYFDHGNYSKQETKEFVERYTKAIKAVAPDQMTTIGLSHYKIVHEWDPEQMHVDFLSFHVYPYASINLSKMERFDAKMYWIQENISKPWIIGETGLNTAKDCEPLNFCWGTYDDQLEFMSYSLERARRTGAWGYSWWSYQDMKFPPGKLEGTCNVSDYGMVDRTDTVFENAEGYPVNGALKHKMSDLPFKKFLADDPYCTTCWSDLPNPGEVYYNIDYLPKHQELQGKVLSNNNVPVEHAIVTLYNSVNKTKYTTFTKQDGSFLLYTGSTFVLDHLDFEIKVTAVNKETVQMPLKTIFNGKTIDPITIVPSI